MATLQFSNTTTKEAIIQLCEFNCSLGDGGISSNSTLLKQFTALANIASSEVWHLLALKNDWLRDDSNNTDLPQSIQNLTASTSKYALPSTAVSLDRIEVKDNSGNFRVLTPIQLDDIQGAVDEFLEDDGMPRYYRLIGQTVELFPAPSASQTTLTGGLKVYFGRGASTFVSTDTTKTPGFTSEYHDLVPIKMSIKWLKVHKPDSGTLTSLIADEIKREGQLTEFEAKKFKSRRPLRVTGARKSSR